MKGESPLLLGIKQSFGELWMPLLATLYHRDAVMDWVAVLNCHNFHKGSQVSKVTLIWLGGPGKLLEIEVRETGLPAWETCWPTFLLFHWPANLYWYHHRCDQTNCRSGGIREKCQNLNFHMLVLRPLKFIPIKFVGSLDAHQFSHLQHKQERPPNAWQGHCPHFRLHLKWSKG